MARYEELKTELAATVAYGKRVAEQLENPDLSAAERADLEAEQEATLMKAEGIQREAERQLKTDERELRIKNIGRDMQIAKPEAETTVHYASAVDALFDNEVFKAAVADRAFRETSWKTPSIEFKATDPQTDNPDDLVQHLRPGIVTPFVYPQRVGALFAQAQMDGSSVSWLDVPTADGGADYVTYGGQKPDGSAEVDVHTTKAAKIATTYIVPDDALDDLTGLRSTLEQILMVGPGGIGVKAEIEYIKGTGTGTPQQLAGIDSLSPTDDSGSGTNVVSDVVYAALDLETETGFPATAAVINPLDYFTLITLEGNDGRPLFAPFGGAYTDPRIGFPFVRSRAVDQGTIYVGAWNAAILYTRQAVNIRATREGIGLADKNLTMFVAETRQALVHPYGAKPFRTVTITS